MTLTNIGEYYGLNKALTATADSDVLAHTGAVNRRKDSYLVFQVAEALTSSGNTATLSIDLETDDNEDFSSLTSHTLATSIAEATLVTGYRVVFHLPFNAMEEYSRLELTVGTENFTAGSYTAYLTDAPDMNNI